MRRRTFRQLRATAESQFHHHVYVILLDQRAAKLRKARVANPNRDLLKPAVYVGMSGLKPEERFTNHKSGIKAARVVQRYGLRLMPELYEIFNPMPFEAAANMERELAEDLRAQGYRCSGEPERIYDFGFTIYEVVNQPIANRQAFSAIAY